MPPSQRRGEDRRPLLSYLRVQETAELELFYILSRAAANAEAEVKSLAGRSNIGVIISRDQAPVAQAVLLRQQAALWRKLESTVRAGRVDAAAAAVEVTLEDIIPLLTTHGIVTDLEALKIAAGRGVDAAWARLTGLSRYELAETVYRTQALASGQVERVIYDHLARGKNWRDLSKGVKDLIDPRVRGGVSYAAQRLARTEINNAFHATSVTTAVDNPYVTAMKWHLSDSHPRPDECNEYAENVHRPGGEAGEYLPQDVPQKPHPQCLCYVTSVVMSDDEILDSILGPRKSLA